MPKFMTTGSFGGSQGSSPVQKPAVKPLPNRPGPTMELHHVAAPVAKAAPSPKAKPAAVMPKPNRVAMAAAVATAPAKAATTPSPVWASSGGSPGADATVWGPSGGGGGGLGWGDTAAMPQPYQPTLDDSANEALGALPYLLHSPWAWLAAGGALWLILRRR